MDYISSTNEDFIKKLQRERTEYNHASQVRMQAKSLMQLSVGIYTEPERFVYELLQNAVDAFTDTGGDTLNILIREEENQFVFMHNGKAFDSKDVEGISDVGNGTKSKDSKKIGYKGIGFKSVFMPSVDHVGIISGPFCFEFDKQKARSLMPSFPPSEGILEPNDVPWQVIPIYAPQLHEYYVPGYNVITIVHTKESKKIGARIESLFSDLQFLLFLRSNNVNIQFERNGQFVFSVGKKLTNAVNGSMPQVTLYKNDEPQSTWIIYTNEVPVPAEVRVALEHDFNTPDKLKGAEKVEISFAIQIRDNEVVPLKNTSVFTFLPTSYRGLRQPFLINSNFITDAGRQQLHQESEWNKLIFSKIPELYLDFVSKISLRYANYTDVLPTIYPDYDTLVNVYRSALQMAFDTIAFVPNRNKNRLLRIREVLVDKTGVSKGIISIDRMLKHLNSKKNTHFSKENLVDDNGIVEYAHNLIFLFDSNEMIHLLADSETTAGISIQEDIKLIRFLSEYFQQPQNNIDSYKSSFADISILYDVNRDLRRPSELFFPSKYQEQNEEASNVFILNEEIFDNIKTESSIVEWLASLGMRELSNMSFVDYLLAHQDYITTNNALSIGRFLFNVWQQENFLEQSDYSEKIKDLNFLAKDGQLRPICNLYFGTKYRPDDDMENVNPQANLYISDDYPEGETIEDWSFFLKKCGAIYKIGIAAKDYSKDELGFNFLQKTAEAFKDCPHRYSNYYGYKNPIINIHFQLSYFTFVEFNKPQYELDKFLFTRVLSMNRSDWSPKDKVYGKINYWGTRVEKDLSDFAPYEFRSRYNSFLEYILATEQKFPTTQGTSEEPTKIFINNSKIVELGGKYLPILAVDSKVHESWRAILPFMQDLKTEDLLIVLERLSMDKEAEKEERKERVSKIYREIIERDEQCSPEISEWAKTHKILSYSDEFLPASDLTYITVDGFKNRDNKVYCEKVGQSNREKLLQLLKTFGVQVITQKDVTTSFANSVEKDEIKERLLDKLQYLALLQNKGASDFDVRKTELEEKVKSAHFYKCDSISLTYGEDNDTISKSTYSKGDSFYYIGRITPALMEPLLSPLCSFLNLGSNNDSKLMVILITDDHQSLSDYLKDCGYDVNLLVAPESKAIETPINNSADNPSNGKTNSDEKTTSEEEDAPKIKKGEEASLSKSEQIRAQIEAQLFLMQEEPSWHFPPHYGEYQEDGTPYYYSTVELEDADENPILIVLKSYKKQNEPFKMNPEELDYIFKDSAYLLIYTGDDIKRIEKEDLVRNQANISLSFSTENLDIEERIDAFCSTLHYFKELHFDFSSFNIAENAESIRRIFNRNKGTQNNNTEEDL